MPLLLFELLDGLPLLLFETEQRVDVLLQILLLGDSLVEKTSFTIGLHPATQQLHGAMRVNGHVRGYINGYVDAEIHGRVNGTVSASIDIGDVQMEELPAHVAPPAQLHSEEGSDEET